MAQTFSVKGWEKHQHYKDRNPPWIRFYNTTLDDYDVAHLPDAAKAHLFGIWLLASRYDNKIPYDAEFVAKKINATEAVDLEQLASMGLIVLDNVASKPLARRKQVDAPETEQSRAEQRQTPIAPKGGDVYSADFERWWAEYPHKVGKDAAWKVWKRAIKRVDLQTMIDAAKRYIATKPADRDWCNPSTWLNQGRWQDAPAGSSAPSSDAPAGKPEETLWRVRTTNWVPGKYWNRDQWGPAPNEPGCKVPSQILAEFEPMRRTG